ncbi:XP_014783371.1PREDICTED: uncharacterized protein LOC106878613 isoform X1 [Octopus vulgaris]|uniref:XP_014783371.1PREDICTED: uncharacterized protein LOC106878613 isoform X1 n=1 Tax=Octopus vulgaris TaxID=6645 RepID=A0AA36BPQ8_OCTVU|nr:XP_014783371.1PREDICTED: uncharacterized protein LOC106878613 isoform X1 [Octopus vulgaris]
MCDAAGLSAIGNPNNMAEKYKEFKNEDDTDYLVYEDEFEPEVTSSRNEKYSLDAQKEIGFSSIEDKVSKYQEELRKTDATEGRKDVVTHADDINEKADDTTVRGDEQDLSNGHSYGVMYFNHAGEATFTTDRVRTTQVEGTTVISTADYASNFNPYSFEKPLKKKSIKYMKAVSIVAILIFFPTGVAAFHYASKAEHAFDIGIERGNIDEARKFAKKSEKFIIFSFFMAFIIAIIVLAIYERIHLSPSDLGL